MEGLNTMRIVMGRGKRRNEYVVPTDKAAREQVAEDLKNVACRGSKLPFYALNGA